MNLYNENDPYVARWLRNLIGRGLIADGVVDERSIVDIEPDDLDGFAQCHFFAGIGGWPYALRLAGWPDDRPVWTGSCPCQPFSTIGQGKGHEDERHLWPAWLRLVRERRPAVVFGEQVASADGRAWLDVVLSDLENDQYAVAAADLPAACVGAPHARQRLFFVAHNDRRRLASLGSARLHADGQQGDDAARCGPPGRAVGVAGIARLEGHTGHEGAAIGRSQPRGSTAASSTPCRFCGYPFDHDKLGVYGCPNCLGEGLDPFWGHCTWLPCRDGKHRPVEPGTQPLADGVPSRVGRLRAYGNAIVAPLAEAFIRVAMTAGGLDE